MGTTIDHESMLAEFRNLTGQTPTSPARPIDNAWSLLVKAGWGHSQFNELLLLLGYDRVSSAFFQFLIDGSPEPRRGATLAGTAAFRDGVTRFRKLAVLRFGNVKFGFKSYSNMEYAQLAEELDLVAARPEGHFRDRHEMIQPIEPISGADTYYLGYLVRGEIEARLKRNPADEIAIADKDKMDRYVEIGRRNHEAYLASDHMDVYVATSMRSRDEYHAVSSITSEVFGHAELAPLRLRWFDPTLAYCPDRVDKGLSEALMLKRAKCTLYLAQETDTLGKDSELASTLAQGKPVVAYVPRSTANGQYYRDLLKTSAELFPGKSERERFIDVFQRFAPSEAWRNPHLLGWLHAKLEDVPEILHTTLAERIADHYERRAVALKETHPLGIQVNLDTGVANGVLVARTIDECARLVRRVVTNSLEFNLEEQTKDGRTYLLLRETTTGSIFRVVTGDSLLTSTFWNFYLA